MAIEIKNQAVGLVEAFKNEPVIMPASAGKGAQPPRIRTAVRMSEPDENQTPIPFAIWDAFEGTQRLKHPKDPSFDLIMDRALFLSFDTVNVQDLPGLDEVIQQHGLDTFHAPVPQTRVDKFLLEVYDAGQIKPQNWRERLTQPIKFGLKRLQIGSTSKR